MGLLFIVSMIWAFSFGLIKNNLAGVDSTFVAFARIFIATLVFLPFLKFKRVDRKTAIRLAITGALQFGMMYIAYLAAFQTLKAYEVALFTIFTPIFITLIDDAFSRRFNVLHLAVALLAVLGTWVIEGEAIQTRGVLIGFLLVQVSNLCYAFGQIYYRRIMATIPEVKDREIFGFLYLGGVIITLAGTLVFTPLTSLHLAQNQIITLIYLGAIASGLGFFLWNMGARRVNAGTLAVFNNLKIPFGVAVSLLFFGEQANLTRLFIGGAIIIAALVLSEWINRRKLTQIKK